ncbi:MAG: hypothetical protein LBP92_00760 [Deltaproteobacteria bacterium]|nr:hypothetical protein [Deltaproteobacteria bacterium]
MSRISCAVSTVQCLMDESRVFLADRSRLEMKCRLSTDGSPSLPASWLSPVTMARLSGPSQPRADGTCSLVAPVESLITVIECL